MCEAPCNITKTQLALAFVQSASVSAWGDTVEADSGTRKRAKLRPGEGADVRDHCKVQINGFRLFIRHQLSPSSIMDWVKCVVISDYSSVTP